MEVGTSSHSYRKLRDVNYHVWSYSLTWQVNTPRQTHRYSIYCLSPIQVVTEFVVEQLCWSKPTRWPCTSLRRHVIIIIIIIITILIVLSCHRSRATATMTTRNYLFVGIFNIPAAIKSPFRRHALKTVRCRPGNTCNFLMASRIRKLFLRSPLPVARCTRHQCLELSRVIWSCVHSSWLTVLVHCMIKMQVNWTHFDSILCIKIMQLRTFAVNQVSSVFTA